MSYNVFPIEVHRTDRLCSVCKLTVRFQCRQRKLALLSHSYLPVLARVAPEFAELNNSIILIVMQAVARKELIFKCYVKNILVILYLKSFLFHSGIGQCLRELLFTTPSVNLHCQQKKNTVSLIYLPVFGFNCILGGSARVCKFKFQILYFLFLFTYISLQYRIEKKSTSLIIII
jgi:hypothetical protein